MMKVEKVDNMPPVDSKWIELYNGLDSLSDEEVIRIEIDKSLLPLARSKVGYYKNKTQTNYKTRYVDGWLYIQRCGKN